MLLLMMMMRRRRGMMTKTMTVMNKHSYRFLL